MVERMASMELDVWQGDWGLPSVDHQCLAVMAYCKFASVPIKFHKANNPWKSPSGDLPVLRHEQGVIGKVVDILNYLRKENWGIDFDLTAKQSADIVAFSAMMEEKLVPALSHLWWVDGKTYSEFTRPFFSRILPFPLNLVVPGKRHRDWGNRLYHLRGGDQLTDNERETKVYKDAKECLNTLSAKLADKDYFFGTAPSSLDAIIFGYLAPLMKCPFPNTMLQNHLKGCANLCALCNRILNQYFPLDPTELEAQRKREEEERNKQAEATDFPSRRRNMMVSGMVALTAMVGYAFLSGLVQIELTDAENNQTSLDNDRPALLAPPKFGQFDRLFEEEDKERRDNEQDSQSGGPDEEGNHYEEQDTSG